MKSADIRGLSPEELGLAERNAAEELWKLRFQHHTGQLQNTSAVREQRRTLARIRTVSRERVMGISLAPGGNNE